MPSLSVLRAVSLLAPGKRVTIFAEGNSYALPAKPKPVPVEPSHPFEEVSKQMLERDAEIRALITAVSERTDGALSHVRAVVSAVALGQAAVVESVKENTRTLKLPVIAKYDKNGRVTEARRQRGLDGERDISESERAVSSGWLEPVKRGRPRDAGS